MEQEQEHEDHEENNEHNDSGFASYEELMDARKITFSDIKEHMSGPVISIVIHVFLLAFLGTIIVFEAQKESKEIQVEMKILDPPEIEKIPEPPEPVEVETEVEVEIERPEVATENVEVTVDDVAVKNTDVQIDLPNVLSVKPSNSALKMPALMSSRSGSGRKGALKKYGGTGRTEGAVMKGLRWLKNHQNPDGSWGDSAAASRPAFTGLALLAFLAHGDTPTSAEFGPTVKKAIMKLVEYSNNEKSMMGSHAYPYGIATYALAEAYALTKIPQLEPLVNRQAEKIILGLNAAGSLDYGYRVGTRSDLSFAGWSFQALKAAFAAGSSAEGLEDAIDKIVNQGLKKTHYDSEKQMFCYGTAPSGGKPTMTAVGVLCLQLFGEGKSDEAQGGLETLQAPANFWFNWVGGPDEKPTHGWALYQWYYQTQAIFQGNNGAGKVWKAWNKMFSSELIKRQKKDGRWETPAFEHAAAAGAAKKGGHGEGNFKGLDQPVYATALCCLMLEVYYRYLPTFKVTKMKAAEKKAAAAGGGGAKAGGGGADAGGGGGDDDDDLGLSLE